MYFFIVQFNFSIALSSPADTMLTCATLFWYPTQSWAGHAEPAAGVMGMLLTAQSQVQHATLPILHLRAMNPSAAAVVSDGGDMQVGGILAALCCNNAIKKHTYFYSPVPVKGLGQSTKAGLVHFQDKGFNRSFL